MRSALHGLVPSGMYTLLPLEAPAGTLIIHPQMGILGFANCHHQIYRLAASVYKSTSSEMGLAVLLENAFNTLRIGSAGTF